jgi:N-acetylglucosaminyldiphosphoundecaprenol N-acetyl-beta-D-mannosaminyltransferase
MEATSNSVPRSELFGLLVDRVTMPQALAVVADALARRERLTVGVVNAAKIVAMRRNRRLHDAVHSCGLVLADGQSVVWAAKALGRPLPERVTGIDLFLKLLDVAAKSGHRVYFLGATPYVLTRMLIEARSRFPGLNIVGARNGYFSQEDEATVVSDIRESKPDLLFLGMPSPKKELFIKRWASDSGALVVHGVGGSFDVLAGITRRAPSWWQSHGLEWLYRLLQEPRRLGWRYLSTNVSFLLLLGRELIAARGRAVPRPGTS